MAEPPHDPAPNVANSNIRASESDASLTELEGVVLGIIWSRQPCSAYVVLRRFEQSTTWGWSSSTGAIYPAIKRLQTRGLLAGEPALEGRRKVVRLSLTEAGREALRRWIGAVTAEVSSVGIDPVRTRANYLAALDPPARAAFLDRAEEMTRAQLRAVPASPPDPLARENWTLEAANIGVTLSLEARLHWLREVRRLLSERGGSES